MQCDKSQHFFQKKRSKCRVGPVASSVTGEWRGGGPKQFLGEAQKLFFLKFESEDHEKDLHYKICAKFHEFWDED